MVRVKIVTKTIKAQDFSSWSMSLRTDNCSEISMIVALNDVGMLYVTPEQTSTVKYITERVQKYLDGSLFKNFKLSNHLEGYTFERLLRGTFLAGDLERALDNSPTENGYVMDPNVEDQIVIYLSDNLLLSDFIREVERHLQRGTIGHTCRSLCLRDFFTAIDEVCTAVFPKIYQRLHYQGIIYSTVNWSNPMLPILHFNTYEMTKDTDPLTKAIAVKLTYGNKSFWGFWAALYDPAAVQAHIQKHTSNVGRMDAAAAKYSNVDKVYGSDIIKNLPTDEKEALTYAYKVMNEFDADMVPYSLKDTLPFYEVYKKDTAVNNVKQMEF